MEFVSQLWLPIILATAIAFIVSALLWTVIPVHKNEWAGVPDQDGLMDLLRKAGVQPGGYLFPFEADRSNKEKMAAAMQKWAEGPSGTMFIVPKGPMSMGKMMGQQIVFFLVVNFFLAYVGFHTLAHGAPYLAVFRVIGAVGFMTYFFGTVPECIWFGRPWKNQWIQIVDALAYALMTAGTFGWLWPR